MVNRDRYGAHDGLIATYFSEGPMYDAYTFWKRFQKSRELFTSIVEIVTNHCDIFFCNNIDCTKREGILTLIKCISVIRQLVYDIVPDALDEYLKMGATTSRNSMQISYGNICNRVLAKTYLH